MVSSFQSSSAFAGLCIDDGGGFPLVQGIHHLLLARAEAVPRKFDVTYEATSFTSEHKIWTHPHQVVALLDQRCRVVNIPRGQGPANDRNGLGDEFCAEANPELLE